MVKPKPRILVPRPDRIRRIGAVAFGWIDAGLWRKGWLRALAPQELAVYVFLCLVADYQGISFYRRDRIAHHLGLDFPVVDRALARLKELELVAYEPFGPHASDGFHQVLALPAGGPADSPLLGLWQPRNL
jgi:hypothetical protein